MTSRRIVHVDGAQTPRNNFILTENLSASGIKFTTNSVLNYAQYFLINLNDDLMREIRKLYGDRRDWVRVGDHYLTRVIWTKLIDASLPIYEVGATFVERQHCGADEMAAFTELMNVSVLQNLPATLRAN